MEFEPLGFHEEHGLTRLLEMSWNEWNGLLYIRFIGYYEGVSEGKGSGRVYRLDENKPFRV